MKEYIMRILAAILTISALLAVFPWDSIIPAPDLFLTKEIDITYTEPDYSDPSKTKSFIVRVNSEEDKAAILKTLTTMETSDGGNCGFHLFAFILHINGKEYKYTMSGDGCPIMLYKKQYYEIKEDCYMTIKAILVKYHQNVGLFSEEYLNDWMSFRYPYY